MDNPTSDSSAPHRTKDCIRNLKFVYTTNGGYDYHQARQTAPTGDCMVIAASVATRLVTVDGLVPSGTLPVDGTAACQFARTCGAFSYGPRLRRRLPDDERE